MIAIGIDNGADGAIVAINQNRVVVHQEVAPVINVSKTGKKRIPNPSRMAEIVRTLLDTDELFAVLERAQPYPKEGAVTSFNYGRGFGAWEGVLAALQVPHAVVDPKVWQKAILTGVEGEDTKARAILKVQRAIPNLQLVLPRCRVPHTGLADAGCMAMFALTLDARFQAGAVKVPPPPPLPR